MKVKDLKIILNDTNEDLEVFAFGKEVTTWGIKTLELETEFSQQFFLSDFKSQKSRGGGGTI